MARVLANALMVTVCTLGLVGCAGELPFPVGLVRARVLSERDGALRIVPTVGDLTLPREGEAVLRWRLVEGGGEVSSGVLADPWAVRHEWVEDGALHGVVLAAHVGDGVIDLPARAGTLEILDDTGRVLASGAWDPDPASETGRATAPLLTDADVRDPEKIVDHHASADEISIDLAILAEGYTEAELDQFRTDVAALARALMLQPDVSAHHGLINVWAVPVVSRDSGIDDPARGVSVDTAFDVSYGRDVERCILPSMDG